MQNEFLQVKSINGFHFIRISLIQSISPKPDSKENKSAIKAFDGIEIYFYYSTETQEEIFEKLPKTL